MAIPTPSQVTAELQKILEKSNLDTMTERLLSEELSQRFSAPMDGHAQLIQQEVIKFVQAQAAATPLQADAVQPAKRSRGPEDAGQGDSGSKVKKALVDDPAASTESKFSLDDRGLLRAQVKSFQGKTYVDLRTFWEKNGEFLPGKKGIMLSLDDWKTVADSFGMLQQALEASDLSMTVQLSGTRRVTLSDFRKSVSVDIREWYDKDGELKPGMKGISLAEGQFKTLVSVAPALTNAAGTPSDLSNQKTATKTPEGAPSNTLAQQNVALKNPNTSQSGGAATTLQSGTGDTLYQLGGSKFASVSQFKGKWMVGLREYYQKDGSWMPGKKGVSLSSDQFDTLLENSQAVSGAMNSKDTTFSLELTTMRKVGISQFKGTHYCNIREYYQKGNELAPGSKGIALNGEQWTALFSTLNTLKSQML